MFLLLLVKVRMEYYLCTTPTSEMFARPDLDVCTSYVHSYGKDGNFYLIFKLTPNSTINSQNDEDIIS